MISSGAEGAVLAALLHRVGDGGRGTARKLVWLSPGEKMRETPNLRRAADSLSTTDFLRALADLGSVIEGAEAAFVADRPEKLRDLFASQAGGDRRS